MVGSDWSQEDDSRNDSRRITTSREVDLVGEKVGEREGTNAVKLRLYQDAACSTSHLSRSYHRIVNWNKTPLLQLDQCYNVLILISVIQRAKCKDNRMQRGKVASHMRMWYWWSVHAIVMSIMADEAASAGRRDEKCSCSTDIG